MADKKSMRVVILGAGLSGLTTARKLELYGINTTVLEARDRLGGRIWTRTLDGGVHVEAGATWFNAAHTQLLSLMQALDIGYFRQYTAGKSLFAAPQNGAIEQFVSPQDEPGSLRVEGGTTALIEALSSRLEHTHIYTATPVAALSFAKASCVLQTRDDRTFEADIVVSTLPPRLLLHSLQLSPDVPAQWKNVATQTQTWMGRSVKFFVSYKTPFWREKGFSGMAFSHGGLIPEMYDHTSAAEDTFALKGFLSPASHELSFEARRAAVQDQLVVYFGQEARHWLAYGDTLWGADPFTNVAHLPELMPHQNNGHPAFSASLFDGRLIVSGSEAAAMYAGYMEGAVRAGERAAETIVALVENGKQ